MGSFSAEWLALREPADAAARSLRLTHAVADVLPRGRLLCALDLGAGTGSNLRFLAESLAEQQSWLLVDHDSTLLARGQAQITSWGAERGYHVDARPDGLVLEREGRTCRVATRPVDLARLDDETGILADRGLVTASALLDLVSERWLGQLALRCRRGGAVVLFALTYDGRIRCAPAEPEDHVIQELVNRHQRTDKGLGPALGPEAITHAERCFAGLGYHVERERSDWTLPPESYELQRQLIEGWAQAAVEIAPSQAVLIQSWRARRLTHVAGRRSELIVGHQDLAGWLPAAGNLFT